MTIFLTGATGYLGSYIVAELRQVCTERLAVLVRAADPEEARRRLWKAWQLHLDRPSFHAFVQDRVDLVLGDLTSPRLGLEPPERERLVRRIDSVIHCAASLNRKSAKSCFNVNLRGTLEVIHLARAAQQDHGLTRFSDVSTMAVAGRRQDALVREDQTIDWQRSDYDPYARTKKFAEHLVQELLPDVPRTVFRPATVMGDSRFPETTQFDMVRAFAVLARLPILPLRGDWRIDIVPADYVGKAVARIHTAAAPGHDAYNLSAGSRAPSYREICTALAAQGYPRRVPRFVPGLHRPFDWFVRAGAATPRRWGLARGMSLLQVFLPYLVSNTVFDNSRVVAELGEAPAPFVAYAYDLLRFAEAHDFQYPYLPWRDVA